MGGHHVELGHLFLEAESATFHPGMVLVVVS